MTDPSRYFNTQDACIPDGINRAILRADQAHDWRLISTGITIPTQSYADQPYVVQAGDGALVCVVTTGNGHEGSAGQHVTSMRSTDGGQTWSPPVPVESPHNPESSYAVLLKTPYGRIYCFYNFNADNIREIETVYPGNPVTYRVDSLGHYVFKYSDDHGKTWSDRYYEVPVRETAVDRANIRQGKVRFFWNVGRPFTLGDAAYLSLHKVGGFGDGFMVNTEGWLVRSENLLTERSPEKLSWETLPLGEVGLRAPEGGRNVAEEQSYTVLSDGSLYVVYRGIDGHPVESYSRDGGRTWQAPVFKSYSDGRPMKHPRAASFVWRCSNGKYLHWFHNHGGRFIENSRLDGPWVNGYDDRNPVWISAGKEADGPDGKIIKWSQPEILLYDDDPYIRISYPDLIELNGDLFITETQKNVARLHRIHPLFLQRLWGQFENPKTGIEPCLLSLSEGNCTVPMPELPKFLQRDFREMDGRRVDLRQGFALSFLLNVPQERSEQVLLDNRSDSEAGWAVSFRNRGVFLTLSDGQTTSLHESDRGLLIPGNVHAVSIIVDGGPKIVSFVIDETFCDGGSQKQFGWSRFSPHLKNVAGSSKLKVSSHVQGLRICGRALMTCEAIASNRDLIEQQRKKAVRIPSHQSSTSTLVAKE